MTCAKVRLCWGLCGFAKREMRKRPAGVGGYRRLEGVQVNKVVMGREVVVKQGRLVNKL